MTERYDEEQLQRGNQIFQLIKKFRRFLKLKFHTVISVF